MYVKDISNKSGVVTSQDVFHAKYIWKKVNIIALN